MGKAISYSSHVTLLRGAGWAKATQEPYMGWNRNTGTVEGEQGRCPVLSPLDFSRNLISLLSLRLHNQRRRLGCPSSKSPITGENLLEARVVPLVIDGPRRSGILWTRSHGHHSVDPFPSHGFKPHFRIPKHIAQQ